MASSGSGSGSGSGNGETARLVPPESSDPIHDAEHRNRRRLFLVLGIFTTFFVLIASLTVWSVNEKRQYYKARASSHRASVARKHLNGHLSSQSKHMTAKCEATVMLARHCEKMGPNVEDEDGNQHCSYLGYERAAHFAQLFSNKHSARWPAPSNLFALTPVRKNHWNFREWESLQPLSESTDVVVDVVETGDVLASEFFDLLRSGSQCGKLTVVSWKHELLSELAGELGCGPHEGCPGSYPDDEFDQVWLIKYVFHPEVPEKDDTEHDLYRNTTLTVETDDGSNRRLMSKHKRNKDGWNVYATVTNQRFDPLEFSKEAGDYPAGGAARGGSWQEESP